MEYNKNHFEKTSDKKTLHKIKKQWVVVSAALLMAIGGGALASHTVHAAAPVAQVNHHESTDVTPDRLQKRTQPRQDHVDQSQLISQQADQLHQRILSNAAQTMARTVKDQSQSTITLYYINETGQEIGSDTYSGSNNESLSTGTLESGTNSKKAKGPNMIHDDNPDPKDYNIDSDAVFSDYQFSSTQQYVTIPLIGKKNSDQNDGNNLVEVKVKIVGSDGNQIENKNTPIHLNGQIGNFVQLRPADLLPGGRFADPDLKNVKDNNNPVSYSVVSDGQAPAQYYLQGNGDGTATLYNVKSDSTNWQPRYVPNGSANQPTITFTYRKMGSAQPIIVTYVDQQTGQPVPNSTDNISPAASDIGKSIDVADSNSSISKTAHGESVPDGYVLTSDNPTDLIYTIRDQDQPQRVTLYVKKKSAHTNYGTEYPLAINLVTNGNKNSDGWTNGKCTIHPQINGDVNGYVTLHATSFTPSISGYHVTPTPSDESYQIHFGSDGKLSVTQHNNSDNVNGIIPDSETSDPSKGIVFHYNVDADQHRNYIHYISSSDVDNSDDIDKDIKGHHFLTTVYDSESYGQPFNDSSYRENVPQGYQFYQVLKVNSNDGKGDTASTGLQGFGSGDQNEYIEVIPNASNITVHYVDQNRDQIAQHTFNGEASKYIKDDGHGHGYTSRFGKFIHESDIEKNSDITLADTPYQLEAEPYHTADGTENPNSTFMYGRQPQDVKVVLVGKNEAAAPVTVRYINQAGNLVGSQSFVGRFGDSVNVVGNKITNESTYQNVPSGYTLNSNQQLSYRFGNQPYTVTLDVTGNPVNYTPIIERVERQSNGTMKVSDIDMKMALSDKQNGNTIEINPSDFIPNGYTPDYSRDSVQSVTLNQDPNAMPKKIVFYYDDKTTNAAPITIRFVDQNHHLVGTPVIVNGNVGNTIYDSDNALSSNNTNVKHELPQVPKGYSIYTSDRTPSPSATFGDSPQTMIVDVTGNQASDKFTINVETENSDENDVKQHQVDVKISGKIGDIIKISPYGFPDKSSDSKTDITSISDADSNNESGAVNKGNFIVPSGYHATDSDSDLDVTILPNGHLSPISRTNFVYERNFGAKTSQITVHYITYDPSNNKSDVKINGKNYREIDQETTWGVARDSDNNIPGDPFDLTPYVDDVPEGLGGYYDIDENDQHVPDVWSKNSSEYTRVSNDSYERTFQKTNQNFYIVVDKNSDGPIIID